MYARLSTRNLPTAIRPRPLARFLSSAPYQHISLQIDDDSIATVALNRPEKKNAFSAQTIAELSSAFSAVGGDKTIRGLILKGNGNTFCAGADLSWMKDTAALNEEGIKSDSMKLRTMLSTCDHLRIPTLCLVNGGCIGGGVGLCSTAKTVVALPDAWFLFSEVRLGIIPAIVSPFVYNRIGKAQCKRYMMIPERITAEDALRIGLVDKVVKDEAALHQYELEWRKLVKASAPMAVGLVSDLVDAIEGKSEAEQSEITVSMLCERRKSKEGKEGMDCFFSKRKPSWVHSAVCYKQEYSFSFLFAMCDRKMFQKKSPQERYRT